ncbi:hypothetical protein DV738_g2485, partial [Chaetothyriales sp. CBS 135597]
MSLRRSARVLGSTLEPLSPSHATGPTASRKRTAEGSTAPKATKRSKASKSSSSEQVPDGPEPVFQKPEPPVTPVRKRRAAPTDTSGDVTAPPPTPTPSLVHLIRASRGRSGAGLKGSVGVEDRVAGPSVTNAVLVTPGGTRKVAYPNGLPESSPSKSGLSRPVATTSSLLEEACAHLIRVDPRMKGLIDKHHCSIFSAEGLAEEIDPFRSLCSGIIGQQVSGAAARSIRDKFVALFNDEQAGEAPKGVWPTPAQVAGTDIARLRLAGLSQRKAEYIQGLAQKFRDGELSADMLMTAPDEEVMERLIAVRGLGKWSVEMFACFGLKRMDILSTGDLGVQRGMAAYFGKDVKKLKAKGGGKWKYMSEQDMLDKSAKYAPYRSLFMWYMWRVEDVDVTVMQTGTARKDNEEGG